MGVEPGALHGEQPAVFFKGGAQFGECVQNVVTRNCEVPGGSVELQEDRTACAA
ncbi:hypothetical protein GCM10027199_79110 [Amycolatopsis magusensis]